MHTAYCTLYHTSGTCTHVLLVRFRLTLNQQTQRRTVLLWEMVVQHYLEVLPVGLQSTNGEKGRGKYR